MGRRNVIRLGGTARSPEDARELHRMGLSFAEIPLTDPVRFLQHVESYQKLKDRWGLAYLCHGPREGDPNNMDTLEHVYLPSLLQVLSLMPRLDMKLLTIHLWLDGRFLRPDVIAYKVGFLQRLLNISDNLDITVCIENLSENADHLSEVFETLPSLRMTLDLGHAQLLTRTNTGFGFMERFPERIHHVHLHDNMGGSSVADDLHLPLGQGSIDFERLFQGLFRIGYHRTLTLELRPQEIQQNLDTVKQRLTDAGFMIERTDTEAPDMAPR